jgi:multiple sugar transport system permease protein
MMINPLQKTLGVAGRFSVRQTHRDLRRRVKPLAWYVIMTLILVGMLLPLFIALTSSFKPGAEILRYPPTLVPKRVTLEQFMRLFTARQFPVYVLNTIVVGLVTTFVSLLVGSLAAYSLAQFKFRGNAVFAQAIVLLYMFPPVLLVIPLYLTMVTLRLQDTLSSLILAYSTFALPFTIWIMRTFFEGLPSELRDAALIDGCTEMGVLSKVILPLSLPGLAAVGAWSFMSVWGEYIFAITFINTDRFRTIASGLNSLVGQVSLDFGVLLAGSILAIVPPVLLFFVAQEYVLEGLTAGAIKG